MGRVLKLAVIVSIASLSVIASAGCSSGSVPALKSIVVSPSDIHIYADYGKQLEVFAIDAQGKETDVSTTSIYRSSDEKVAIVNTVGFVEGKDRGTATITVAYTVGAVTKTAEVPVIIELFGGTETFSGIS